MQLPNHPADFYAPDEEVIDVRRLWRVVRQSWRSIFGLCLVVSLLATLWVMRIAPVYRASTTIMIESQAPKTISIEEVYGPPKATYDYLQTQFDIIKNRDIAELVANELDLWNNPYFAPPRAKEGEEIEERSGLGIREWISGLVSSASDRQAPIIDAEERRKAAVIGGILGPLSVEPVEYTQLVVVSFEATDRQLAAEVVNTLARVYIQSQMDAKLQSTQEARSWLGSRLEDLKANLDASQQALQQFRDQENILDVAGGQTLGAQELNELTTRLGDARRARVEAENIYRELGGSANYSVNQLMNMPVVLKHPLVQSLAQSHTEAQQDVTNLARRYGPEHPKMIAANARVESVQAELKPQVLQVANGIEKEYRLAQRNEQNLIQELAALKQDVAIMNRKEFRLRELEQRVDTDQRLYDMFFNRAKETSETVGFQTAHARVVEKAVAPISPIKPDKRRTVMMAFLLSGLLGVGLSILRDFLDNTLRTPEDVLEKLKAPLLGALPALKLKKGHVGPYLGYLEDVQSGFSEAVRSIRTGLVLSGLQQPHKITVVTSTNPGEGKSTVAINLAVALAQMETVLLIDADLRRPSIAAAFALPSDTPGLSNVLAQSEKLEDCLQKIEAGFDVLPAGIVPGNPQEMLSTTGFKQMVTHLSEHYDRIIIDSAPVNAVSDSLILATLADSLVYVVKADVTPQKLALNNIALIKHNHLPLTGVVLNRMDIKKQDSYGKDGYYKNYYGYGQS
jgi:succinoglycan biosynthesis transport protein ExoP